MDFLELNHNTIYNGRVFQVEAVDMRLPNGKVHTYDLIRHNPSVSILPLDSQGNIYFVEQHRVGVGASLLELPAGVIETGEEPAVCAAREIREETGYSASHIQELGQFYLAPGYCNESMFAFLATGLNLDPLRADEDEFLNLRAIPAVEAYHLAFSGQIHDSKTLATLFLAHPHLQKWL